MQDTPETPGASPSPPPPQPSAPPPLSAGSKPLVQRVRDLLVQPKPEWAVIDREPATVASLFTSYVMILAAIPPVAMAIGLFLFVPRGNVYGVAIGLSTGSIVAGMVVQYLLGLLSVYVVALIIDALAPTFGSRKDQVQAMKVAAYYPTAVWVASILLLIPALGAIAALVGAIYSLYLLFVGLPILMKTPPDKAVAYFVVTLIAAIVVLGIVNAVVNRVVYAGMF